MLVGNPVRSEFADLAREPVSPPLVAIVGGSLGSGTLNAAGIALAELWRDRDDIAVHHVTGPRNFDECRRRLTEVTTPADRLDYTLVPYEDRLDRLYARCSLALCRAGAGTVAELTAAGVPSVLVPLPGAPSDHQTRNARTLEAHGAAVVVPDAECDGKRLDPILSSFVADDARLDAMSRAAARDGPTRRRGATRRLRRGARRWVSKRRVMQTSDSISTRRAPCTSSRSEARG